MKRNLALTLASTLLVASSGCSLLISLDDVTPDSPSDASLVVDAARPREGGVADVSLATESMDSGGMMSAVDAGQGTRDAQSAAEAGPSDAGRCADPDFPVSCPARGTLSDGGVRAGCWDDGTDCSTITSCSGRQVGCKLGFRFDCAANRCVEPCSSDYPVRCPAVGNPADGGVKSDCWTANTDCTTVKSCAGLSRACVAGGVFDCAANRCVFSSDGGVEAEAAPPLTCEGGQAGCGGRCVDLQSDALNCGRCANACGAGKQCFAGQCCSTPAAGGNCNLPACGCAAGEVCAPDVEASGLKCVKSDELTEGSGCTQQTPCAPGLGCFGGVCKRYCGSEADCPLVSGVRECLQTVWLSNRPIGGVLVCRRICDPVNPQSPQAPLLACPAGQGCFPALAPGASDCTGQLGTLTIDQACVNAFDCAPGLFCSLSKVCLKFCSTDADCPVPRTCRQNDPPYYAGTRTVGFCTGGGP